MDDTFKQLCNQIKSKYPYFLDEDIEASMKIALEWSNKHVYVKETHDEK